MKEETPKLAAFFRRDLLVLWSYRAAFFSDWANMLLQVALFYFVSRLVDPARIPTFGGRTTTFLEFTAIGVAFSSFVQVSFARVMMAIRQEQVMGTLESLFVTPTAPATLQLGLVVYDLIYIPVRTAIYLALIAVLLGADFRLGGFLPATAILLSFIPFAWGLGVVSAAAILTLRRGSGLTGLAGPLLTLFSGAYVPLSVLPGWMRAIARVNPLNLALDGARHVLLGNQGWAAVWPRAAILLPMGVASLYVGSVAFRAALNRERRRGTLGLY